MKRDLANGVLHIGLPHILRLSLGRPQRMIPQNWPVFKI